jgi:hypothetical protein
MITMSQRDDRCMDQNRPKRGFPGSEGCILWTARRAHKMTPQQGVREELRERQDVTLEAEGS